MTEQEKREKAIEEMAKDLELSCDDNENNNHSDCSEWSDCNKCQARYLIEKCHYRKEEEVQKETAREIIYGIVNLTHIIELDEEVEEHIYSHLFDECKKYGLNEQGFIDRII